MDSIEYYNKYAVKVFEDTVNLNMEDMMKAFLEKLQEGDTILDLGCGSGRDSLTFYDHGYDVTPMDASEEMCKLAEIHTGLEVLHMSFEEMPFEDVFDGIWACGSLVHVPKSEIQNILNKIADALKNSGIFYMSVKYGDYEGFRGERYFSDYTEESIETVFRKNGNFEVLDIWQTSDVRSGHSESKWVNVLARKK